MGVKTDCNRLCNIEMLLNMMMEKLRFTKHKGYSFFPICTSFFYGTLLAVFLLLPGQPVSAQTPPPCTAQTKRTNFWYFGCWCRA